MMKQQKINPSPLKNYGYLLSLVSAVVFSFSISALAMPPKAQVPADEHEIQRRWMDRPQGMRDVGVQVKHILQRHWNRNLEDPEAVDHDVFLNHPDTFIHWVFDCTYNAMDPAHPHTERQGDGRLRFQVRTRNQIFRLIYDPVVNATISVFPIHKNFENLNIFDQELPTVADPVFNLWEF